MRKPLPVEVEAMSARRWARLERSLFARWDEEQGRAAKGEPEIVRHGSAPRSGRRLVFVAFAVFLVAASIVCSITWRRAGEGVALDRTSRIATGANGSHLSLQGLTLDVEPDSTVVLGSPSEHGMLIVLDRGGIVCEVAPRPAGAPLFVQAGPVQVKVVGTRFSVARSGETARVAVEHGVVEVLAAGRVARIGAGQVWPAEVPAPGLSAATASPSPSAAHDGPATGANPTSAAPASDSAPKSPAAASAKAASGRAEHRATQTAATQARFEAAAALEGSDPVRALELYRGLEGGSDSWAQHALYAHGRLEAARGNRAQARQLLERYLTRFPHGPNSVDARSMLDRLP